MKTIEAAVMAAIVVATALALAVAQGADHGTVRCPSVRHSGNFERSP